MVKAGNRMCQAMTQTNCSRDSRTGSRFIASSQFEPAGAQPTLACRQYGGMQSAPLSLIAQAIKNAARRRLGIGEALDACYRILWLEPHSHTGYGGLLWKRCGHNISSMNSAACGRKVTPQPRSVAGSA